jgi:hypothetical protein
MSDKQENTQTQTRDPYAPVKPLLQSQTSAAQAYMKNPGSSAVYDGPRVAGMSDRTKTGLDNLFASDGARTSEDYLKSVVGGDYLEAGNPYVKQVQDAVRSSVMPSVNSAFSSAGMSGSTLHQGMLEKGLTEGMASPLFANYENERNRQMSAASSLPGVSQGIIGNQLGAGQIGEGYTQAQIDADMKKFEEQRTAALRPILETLPISTSIGNMGGTSSSTQTQTTQQSPLKTALGAGMMGASLFGPGALFGAGSAAAGAMAGGAAPQGYGSSWAPWTQYGA